MCKCIDLAATSRSRYDGDPPPSLHLNLPHSGQVGTPCPSTSSLHLPRCVFRLFTTTDMPPPTSNLASDRPRTQSKNANAHPGTAAQEALRVNAPRRDPTVIQKEKDAVKERKALKVQEKETKLKTRPQKALLMSSMLSKRASKRTMRQRCHVRSLKVECQ